MKTYTYPAVFTLDSQEGGYVVTFPDFPEAITQGNSLNEARCEAVDCLDEALAGRLRLGKPLPEPSALLQGGYLITTRI